MYYCGVCRSIGRNFGQFPRFGLVNESAALALILSLASGTAAAPETIKRGCIAHPYKKTVSVINNAAVDYAAAVNVMLVYFKLLDSWHDDRSILSKTGAAAVHRAFRKASKRYPIASDSIYFAIKNLTALEHNRCASIDEACEPFASMMSDLFMWKDSDTFASSPVILDLLGKIGYNVGKWIYLIDAASDIEEDRKNKSYNVLNIRFKEQYDAEYVKFILEMCLASCADAWERLKEVCRINENDSCLNITSGVGTADNLFYVGMRYKSEKICKTKAVE